MLCRTLSLGHWPLVRQHALNLGFLKFDLQLALICQSLLAVRADALILLVVSLLFTLLDVSFDPPGLRLAALVFVLDDLEVNHHLFYLLLSDFNILIVSLVIGQHDKLLQFLADELFADDGGLGRQLIQAVFADAEKQLITIAPIIVEMRVHFMFARRFFRVISRVFSR